jgi:hypothetical protein
MYLRLQSVEKEAFNKALVHAQKYVKAESLPCLRLSMRLVNDPSSGKNTLCGDG